MKRLNLLFAFLLCSLFINTGVLAQSITLNGATNKEDKLSLENNDGSFVEVSIDLFKAIERWQKQGVADGQNLQEYLSTLDGVSTEETQNFLTAHQRNSESNDNSSVRAGDCNCTVLTMNTAHEVVPNPLAQFNHDGHDGNNWFWDRVFFKQRFGAATRMKLHLRGKHRATSYEHSTSGSANASNSYGMIKFNYLCTSGELVPTDCGCEKEVDVEARYFGRMKVKNTTGGPWSKASFAKVEDRAAFMSYTKDNTTFDNQLENVQVGASISGFLARSKDENWNPDFWIAIGEFAGALYDVIDGEEGSFSGTTISELTTQLVGVAQEGFYTSQTGTTSDGDLSEDMSMLYSGGLQLIPNNTTVLSMISNAYCYARGYGGDWRAQSETSSAFSVSAIVPYDNSDPSCCNEQSAKWISGAMYESPSSIQNLKNIIGSHLTLFAPWDNLSDTNNDGNIDVTNQIGLTTNEGQCNNCAPDTAPAGLFTSNANSQAGTIQLNWIPLEGAEYYKIKVFKIVNGNEAQYPTMTSYDNDVTFTNYHYKNSYRFTVTAYCEGGQASQESENEFFGIRKIERPRDRNDINPGGRSIGMTIFPNPAQAQDVSISLPEMGLETANLTIRNIMGTAVDQRSIDMTTKQTSLKVDQLLPGIYLVELSSGNEIIDSQKLIISGE